MEQLIGEGGRSAPPPGFSPEEFASELTARPRAIPPPERGVPILAVGDVRLDPATHRVWRGDAEVRLPDKEFRILEYLLRQPGHVVTRSMIEQHVWEDGLRNVTNVIDVHILKLRRKLGDPSGRLIQTVRGSGYRLTPSA